MSTQTKYTAHQLAEWASDTVAEYDKQHGLREAMALVGVPDDAAQDVLAICHEVIERTEDS